MTAALFTPDQRGLTISSMTVSAVSAYNNLSVSAALPAIGDGLGNLAYLPWVITIELITAAIAVLAVGPLVDAVGTRAVYRSVLVLFALTSVLCAVATSIGMLIVARGLQGLAAGAIIANVMTAIGLGVPEALRARAYAANSAVWGIMGFAGPALAAVLVTAFEWRAIFLVNVPVAVVAGIVGWNAFPGPAGERNRHRPDGRGIALVTVFTLLSLGALSTVAWWTPLALLAALVTVGAYLLHERGVPDPVLRIGHIVDERLRWLHVTALLVLMGGVAANAFLPVYVKGARGGSTAAAAFSVVFLTVGWTSGSFLASRIGDFHRGERVILGASLILAIATATAAAGVALTWPLWVVFGAYVLIGIGLGGAASSGLATLQSKAEPSEMGRVNSAHQFIRTLGFTYGAALGGAILFVVVARRLGDADAVRGLLGDDGAVIDAANAAALEAGFAWSLAAATALAIGSIVSAARLLRSSGPAPGPTESTGWVQPVDGPR